MLRRLQTSAASSHHSYSTAFNPYIPARRRTYSSRPIPLESDAKWHPGKGHLQIVFGGGILLTLNAVVVTVQVRLRVPHSRTLSPNSIVGFDSLKCSSLPQTVSFIAAIIYGVIYLNQQWRKAVVSTKER